MLVVTAGRTTDDMLTRAVDNLSKTRGRLLGIVLNRAPLRGPDSSYYGARYGGAYGYSEPDADTRKGAKRTRGRDRRASSVMGAPGATGPRRRSGTASDDARVGASGEVRRSRG